MNSKNIKISILGVGLIGGSLGLAIKKSGLKTEICGFDKTDVLNSAIKKGAIDCGFSDLKKVVENADVIFLAMPIKANIKILKKVVKFAKADAEISEFGSVKNNISNIGKNIIRKNQKFIPIHPMAGSEKRGIENANQNLFEKSIFIICSNDLKKTKFLKLILNSLNINLYKLNSQKHDKIVSEISHLPQILSILLINSINEKNISFKLASGGLKDLTRIASSSFGVWMDILSENKSEILKTLKYFKNNLTEFENTLAKNNYSKINKYFKNANKRREELFR